MTKNYQTMTKSPWYTVSKNICSHLKARGYSMTFKNNHEFVVFYYNKEFIFHCDLQILGEKNTEEILIQLLKEKANVHSNSKN